MDTPTMIERSNIQDIQTIKISYTGRGISWSIQATTTHLLALCEQDR